MYCEQCGQELDDDARFCTSCGASIGVSEDAAADGVADGISGGAHTEPGEVHAVSGGAHTESGGVAAMHAEQVQAESASAQAENKPVSFSTVMNETKARTKRRMPIPILIALVIALAVTSAVAAYYVYTTYAASQQEGQTDTAQEYEEPPEINPEFDAAIDAYADILDEYQGLIREFSATGEGTFDWNTADSRYPDVAYAVHENASYKDKATFYAQYAYSDIDNNGIPELVMRVGDETTSLTLTQMFVCREGKAAELFNSRPRDSWSFYTDGYLNNTGNGGFDSVGTSIYKFENNDKNLVESISYEPVSSDDGGNDDSLYTVTREIADETEELDVSYSDAKAMFTSLKESHTAADEETFFDWQTVELDKSYKGENSQDKTIADAYGEIIGEYRDFMSYLDAGGTIDELGQHVQFPLFYDYPHLAYTCTEWDDQDDLDINTAYIRYACPDINNDGTPELIIGVGDASGFFVVIQAFTYYEDSLIKFLENNLSEIYYYGFCIDGHVFYSDDYDRREAPKDISCGLKIYELSDGKLQNVESISYISYDGSNISDDAICSVTHSYANWEESEELKIPYSETKILLNDLKERYPEIDVATSFDWQDL